MTTQNPLPHTHAALLEAIGTAIGTASMCWENIDQAGVFQSEQASAIVDRLVAEVTRITGYTEPHLGLATTGELITELAARSDLDYRTV